MSASSAPASAPTLEPGTRAPLSAVDIIRTIVIIAALATFALWGALAWIDSFPWNIVAAVATPAIALTIWAVFVSPKAVVPVHPFVRVLIELLIFAAATIAWWSMGQGVIGLAFALVAIVSGVVVGRRTVA